MKKIKSLFAVIALVLINNMLMGQMGINTTTPDSSAALHVESNDKGVLFPKVSLLSATDNTTIANPAFGLIVNSSATTIAGPGLYINMGSPALPRWERYDYYDANSPNLKVNKLIYRNATVPTKILSTPLFEWRLIKETSTTYTIQARLKNAPSAGVSIIGSSILWSTSSVNRTGINTSWTTSDWATWKNILTNTNNWDSMAFLNVSNDPTKFYKLGTHVELDIFNLLVLEIL